MNPFSRKGAAETAKEIAAHLSLVDDVANLQKMQKELADAIARLNDRLKDFEVELRTLKPEVQLAAMEKTTQMVQTVQGAFHEKLTDLTVRISKLEAGSVPLAIPQHHKGQ
jgi:predicted  nucleic acid-binding Zn-ribbon protein